MVPEFALVPTIDFSPLSTEVTNEEINTKTLSEISRQVMDAFRTTGFLYLKNSGLTADEVRDLNQIVGDFFRQPEELKQKFARGLGSDRSHGWIPTEFIDPEKPVDLKEAFNIILSDMAQFGLEWPSEQFETHMLKVFNKLTTVSFRFLMLIAIGLGLDPNFFDALHSKMGSKGNITTLRCLYYPELKNSEVKDIKPGQLRCGDHADFGTITLLISEDISGLQVLTREGKYLDLTKAEDPSYILVNVGLILQRWTDDELIAARHRVVVNTYDTGVSNGHANGQDEDPVVCPKRQSFGFFVNPDSEAIVEALNDKSKYEPITALEFLTQAINKLFKK